MSTHTAPMSVEAFLADPEMHGYELIDGEPVPMAETTADHGFIVGMLAEQIILYRQHCGFPLTVLTESAAYRVHVDQAGRPREAVRYADLSLHLKPAEAVRQHKAIPGAADIVVEVVSVNDTWNATKHKADMWLANGAQRVWILAPGREVHVLWPNGETVVLNESKTLTDEALLPGFACPVARLFGA